MSDQTSAPSVLLISDDSNVVEAIINGNTTDLKINARENVGATSSVPYCRQGN